MKRALASVLVAGLGVAAFSTASMAGQNANAKILLHLMPTTTKAACTATNRVAPTCNTINTSGALYPTLYFAYVLVTDGNQPAGIGGLQCGINYEGAAGAGVDVFTWTLCATLEFVSTGWPNAGGGNLITWDTATKCQRTEPGGAGTGVTAGAGYFYCGSYTADVMSITPRPVDGKAKVADCSSNEDLIGGTGFPINVASHLGTARFGVGAGYNPCGAVTPVQATTWSGVKAGFSK